MNRKFLVHIFTALRNKSHRAAAFSTAVLLVMLVNGCGSQKSKPGFFTVLESASTGIDFANRLKPTPAFNMFKYMYFYNGAGIGAGDFNNDSLTDLFFASNQGQSSLYLNEGNLRFRNVTGAANIPNDSGWSTGVSVVDINNDGLLDIYVCRVGNFESLQSHNLLLVNKGNNANGIPVFEDQAESYGLDFSGFSTQAAFFDYDLDGDLDMYLMNHSLRFNGTFSARNTYFNTYDSLSGDRFYRNDKGRFTDVTRATGINSSIIGYGLGIAVSDINLDGYPDLYIGNDFHENDYLYINQRNGTFTEELTSRVMHTSQFSMGVDVADINNDAQPEIVSMDMLPSDPYILKRSLGEDAYDIFNFKISHGYNHQYARNSLQFNTGTGMFSEIGLYAGVYATDWSWAPLWMDFDNDGLKDLFVSNGIPKRLNDIDYVNYVSNSELQEKIRSNRLEDKDMTLINKFPEIKLPNRFFHNNGALQFTDYGDSISNNPKTFSNGAVYADLDNDGDLDIVVNNIDDEALVYRNNSSDFYGNHSLRIDLQGDSGNRFATGAKLIAFAGSDVRTYEKFPVKGFQSSMESSLLLGLAGTGIDSLYIIWPDNTFQKPEDFKVKKAIRVQYHKGLPAFDYKILSDRTVRTTRELEDITASTKLFYSHVENPFVEFDREPLIPHMVSREGPALAVGDINGDGLEDIFVGSSKGNKPAVFIQGKSGQFSRTIQPALEKDSMFEETDACWIDVNNDGFKDLVAASGGNEYYGDDIHLTPRLFMNNGKGSLTEKANAFGKLFLTASCMLPCDFNNDGMEDLFVGGRAVPWEYGETPSSYLLQNDGTGNFSDVTEKYSATLKKLGFVTSALWFDMDKDGDKDLIVTLEWGGIEAFINDKGRFNQQPVCKEKGWWNFVKPCDIDDDGDIDWIAGNLGLNSRLKASKAQPVRMYYYDFDGNDKKDQLLTYYLNGKEIPFANKEELQKQLPSLKKQFLYAEDFAKASLNDLFGKDKLEKATVLTAEYFSNAVLINEGKGIYRTEALPWKSQLTTYRDAQVVDANGDERPDILLFGNFYDNNIQMGRYDADFGSVLLNRGNGGFAHQYLNPLIIRGQVRKIKPLRILNQQAYVLARNNDSLLVIKYK